MCSHLHVIDLTKRIVIGAGVLESFVSYLPEHLKRNSTKFLVVSGRNVWSAYAKRLEEALRDQSFEVELVECAHVEVAESVASRVLETGASVVVGFGGGKSIDVAKYAASKTGRLFVSAPTAASHDGIVSSFASLKGREKPVSFKAVEPVLLVADLEIMASAPKKLLAAGVGDAVAKLTAVLDWRLAHKLRGEYYGEYAANLALLAAKHVMKHAKTIAKGSVEGVRLVVEALISSSVAMSVAGSTRPASGSEHLFSHALDILLDRPALHGEQVGVGTIMMAKLHGANWRRVRRVLKVVGAPTSAKELGVSEEKVIEALTIAHTIRPERYTILGRDGLSWEAAERLARETKVIS